MKEVDSIDSQGYDDDDDDDDDKNLNCILDEFVGNDVTFVTRHLLDLHSPLKSLIQIWEIQMAIIWSQTASSLSI